MGLPALKNQNQFQIDRKDLGKADTLKYNVLSYVAEEQYDRAVETLNEFLNSDSPFPNFKPKVERYVLHSVDLVNAIRAKRKFPGMSYMTMAKQQEINEKFREHFQELQDVLSRIEKINNSLKLDDIRSTVWVLRALVHGAFAVLLIAFVLEATRGLGDTFNIVVDDGLTRAANWIFEKLFR